jgi:hypothetical protein
MATFISQTDPEFILDHGAQELEARFAEADLDPYHLKRASCI